MTPEESEPGLLVGRHVVEVGMRQAWPFVTIADPGTGREVRVYVDAPLTVTPGATALRDDGEQILAALERLNGGTVAAARNEDGTLVLEVEDTTLRVSGEADEQTGGSPWRIGLQTPGPDAAAEEALTRFGVELRLSVQRALWGMLVPSIRAVALGWGERVGRARFVFDDVPGEVELELVRIAETEVLADCRPGETVGFSVDVRLAGHLELAPDERWWAYVRHEPSGGTA